MNSKDRDTKKHKKRERLTKQQKLEKRADRLREQAQIDLEGYVTCRSALRAVREELKEETERYEKLQREYDELKDRRSPHRILYYKHVRLHRCKKHVKELTRARKRLRRDMKEHRDGVRRRKVTNAFACVAAVAMIAMLVWRIRQVGLGVYYLSMYADGESPEASAIAVCRQLLRATCIVYGLAVIWQSLQVWFMKKEGWTDVIRLEVERKSYILMLLGVPLQLMCYGDMLTNAMMLITIICQMCMASLLSTKRVARRLVKLAGTVYIGGIAVVALYSVVFCRNFELPTDMNSTSTKPVANRTYISQLWEMSTEPEFYHMGVYGGTGANGYDMVTIPGLLYAMTINCDTKEVDCCTSMTPQGIAVTDKYIYVSAYCSTKQHRSVIFMIDTASGDYVKTIVLKNTTHAGGLAYDTKNDVLWVSSYMSVTEETGKTRYASISCLTLESLEAYDFEEMGKSILYRNTCPVMFPATSFITYYNGHIYAGYWKKDKNSQSMAAGYEIVNGGTALAEEPEEAFYIPGRVQGMQVYRGEIIFSISYGIDESMIEVYDAAQSGISNVNYSSEKPRQEIKLPQKLEQIYSYGGRLYCLFESGSFAYRLTAPVCMDRIVTLDEEAIVKNR